MILPAANDCVKFAESGIAFLGFRPAFVENDSGNAVQLFG